ncbi:MAG: hypothetical protein K8R88_13160 [Armatimonadetes bacterium]|nr:hypothetical protein [Armatimonadota bacterium]
MRFAIALTPAGVKEGSQGVEDPWKESQTVSDPGEGSRILPLLQKKPDRPWDDPADMGPFA